MSFDEMSCAGRAAASVSQQCPSPSARRLATSVRFGALLAVALGVASLGAAGTARAAGTVSLGTAVYTENFDTLANTGTSAATPNGWFFTETGTGSAADGLYAAGTGSGNAGNAYSFGAAGSTERAFGGLQSGTVVPTVGAQFTNATGATITALLVEYTGEQWRLGTLGRADRLDVQFSLDATSLSTGTWTDIDALDFTAPTQTGTVGLLDGNAAANRTAISGSINGLAIPAGATVWVRWLSVDAPGADDGLAIDDVSVVATTGGIANAPISATATPAAINTTAGTAAATTLSANDADSIVNGASITSAAVPGIALGGFAPAIADGGAASATLNVAASVVAGNYNVVVTFTNNEGQSTALTVPVTVAGAAVRIRDIQGAAHRSPLVGQSVGSVPGVVTARRSNGFFMEDWLPDADPATSEGIFVFTSTAPTVTVGQTLLVSGVVSEFRPGGDADNLTLTQITSPSIATSPVAGTLPAPVLIGRGGRVPPAQQINGDGSADVESGGDFDITSDGIDFYESLESMRVRIDNAAVVGATNGFGELWVVADGGADAGLRTTRGGIVVQAGDFNPERIQIDDDLLGAPMPRLNVGASAPSISGIAGYSFGNFEVLATSMPAFVPGALAPEVTPLAAQADRLTVASYNVENLRPADGAAKFNRLASQIVNNLRSPDVIAAIEVQDNNGATNDSIVDANTTLNTLVSAIAAAGGPSYQFRQIDPVDDQDGGEPGGNIRVAYLFNPARVAFVDRAGGTPTAANAVLNVGGVPQLQFSPGRIDPTNTAFNSSRKPLAAEFLFKGNRLFLIANHFNSKGGDQPLFGRFQPPVLSSEAQRIAQATLVGNFVQEILDIDPAARVVVLGDLNDFEFSPPLAVLKSAGLTPLVETLPPEERYTYVFDGNSQVLDHIMASSSLLNGAEPPEYDVVHVNAEFADQASDHDPEVARFLLPRQAITASFTAQSTPFALNRKTQQFSNTVTLSNSSGAAIPGPLRVVFDGLPAGITLANSQGLLDGKPYLQVDGLAVGATATLSATYNNPAKAAIACTIRVYQGPF